MIYPLYSRNSVKITMLLLALRSKGLRISREDQSSILNQPDSICFSGLQEFENVLLDSSLKNWTIIRPYITYNTRRIQLGGLELVTWLTAVFSGRPLVLPKDVGMHETTMTYGGDVARAMVVLLGNKKAYGEAFHITGIDHMKWNDVAEVYRDVIEEQTGYRPKLYIPDTSDRLSAVMGNAAQIRYDRMYDRIFDNSKLTSVCRD